MSKQLWDKSNALEKGAGTVIIFIGMVVILGVALVIANLFRTSYAITKAQNILDMQAIWGAEQLYASAGDKEIEQVCARIKTVLEHEKLPLKSCTLQWSTSSNVPTKIALRAHIKAFIVDKTITAIAGAKQPDDDHASG